LAATLGSVLFAWPGMWLGRFGAAQLAALFFFLALGFAIRLVQRASVPQAIAATICVVASLMIYQGLAVLMLIAPFCTTLFVRTAELRSRGAWIRPAVPFLLGLGLYAVFFVAVSKVGGGHTYEGDVIAGVSLSISGLWRKLQLVYWSAFGETELLLPLFLASALLLYANRTRLPPGGRDVARMLCLSLAILALPVLALVYLSDLHARDPERVLFPVSAGFCLIMMFVLKPGREPILRPGLPAIAALVLVALTVSASLALDVSRYWTIQRDVIVQVLPLAAGAPPEGLLIRDHSGVLGDVYTFLALPTNGGSGTALQAALANYGVDIPVRLCTPADVDRLHDVARRYPISTTKRCDVVPVGASLALDARSTGGKIVIGP
jgi:hypothetical protein